VLRLLPDMSEKHGCILIVVTHEKEVIELFDNTVSFLELNRAYQYPYKG